MTNKGPIKYLFASLVLLGFLSVAFLWSTGMHEGGDHVCIAAAIQNGDCPNTSLSSVAVAFHLNTLQSFTNSGLHVWQFVGMALILAFAALAAFTRLANKAPSGIAVSREDARPVPLSEGYKRWLSLLEHSPSLLPGRV